MQAKQRRRCEEHANDWIVVAPLARGTRGRPHATLKHSTMSPHRSAGMVRFFNTFLVVTNITGATVRINCTFGSASCDGIRFGDQTSQASANGVSKFVGHTHGSGSTWAWVTRIWFQDASIQKKMIIFVDRLIFFDRKALENISNIHKFTKKT